MKNITYWFYCGERCIGSVLVPEGTSKEDARSKRLEQLFINPTIHSQPQWMTPGEVRSQIINAEMRTYPNEG